MALTKEKALRDHSVETAAQLERQARALEACSEGNGHVAELERTIAEQTVHIEALNEQIQWLSDQQAELTTAFMTSLEQANTIATHRSIVEDLQAQLASSNKQLRRSAEAIGLSQQRSRDLETELAASLTQTETLETELRLSRQNSENLAAGLAQTQDGLVDANHQLASPRVELAAQRQAAVDWAAQAADLEARLARVRDSLPGRIYLGIRSLLRKVS